MESFWSYAETDLHMWFAHVYLYMEADSSDFFKNYY